MFESLCDSSSTHVYSKTAPICEANIRNVLLGVGSGLLLTVRLTNTGLTRTPGFRSLRQGLVFGTSSAMFRLEPIFNSDKIAPWVIGYV